MVKYHVGCGFAGIYAGILNPKTKDGYRTWRNKTDSDCILSLAEKICMLAKKLQWEKR